MHRIGSEVAFVVLLSLVPRGYCQPPDQEQKLAREAVATFVKAYNTQSVDGVLEVTGARFFEGVQVAGIQSFGPGALVWISEGDRRKCFERLFAGKLELDSNIVRVERYEDYRKKKLAEVPTGLSEFSKTCFLMRRQAMDEVVDKEGFIVFIGPQNKEAKDRKGEITEGILIRMVKGRPNVVGFSSPALAWMNGWEK